ncbi:hypothetical protein SBV1_580008 [Verrucomicrobia bacterium]|nr:hypothetical protein SBV1_580008 [Verrucomicrobiota bacterium]
MEAKRIPDGTGDQGTKDSAIFVLQPNLPGYSSHVPIASHKFM